MKKEQQIRLESSPDPEKKKLPNFERNIKQRRREEARDSYTVFEAPLPRTSLYCKQQEQEQ